MITCMHFFVRKIGVEQISILVFLERVNEDGE